MADALEATPVATDGCADTQPPIPTFAPSRHLASSRTRVANLGTVPVNDSRGSNPSRPGAYATVSSIPPSYPSLAGGSPPGMTPRRPRLRHAWSACRTALLHTTRKVGMSQFRIVFKFTLQAAAHRGHRLRPGEPKGAQDRTRNRVRGA